MKTLPLIFLLLILSACSRDVDIVSDDGFSYSRISGNGLFSICGRCTICFRDGSTINITAHESHNPFDMNAGQVEARTLKGELVYKGRKHVCKLNLFFWALNEDAKDYSSASEFVECLLDVQRDRMPVGRKGLGEPESEQVERK